MMHRTKVACCKCFEYLRQQKGQGDNETQSSRLFSAPIDASRSVSCGGFFSAVGDRSTRGKKCLVPFFITPRSLTAKRATMRRAQTFESLSKPHNKRPSTYLGRIAQGHLLHQVLQSYIRSTCDTVLCDAYDSGGDAPAVSVIEPCLRRPEMAIYSHATESAPVCCLTPWQRADFA